MNENERNALDNVESQIALILSEIIHKKVDVSIDNLSYLNLDSLTRLELLAQIEKHFGLVLTEEVAVEFTSISSIARIVYRSKEV